MVTAGDDADMDLPDPPSSRIAELAHAYLQADYLVAVGRREWRLRIGASAAELESVLGAARYLFMTAWNPRSTDTGLAGNMEADQRLQARLQQAGFQHHSALGSDIAGEHREHGWLVLDLPEATADLLAREFAQAGVVYWRRGQPVRLRMQSTAPAQWRPHPFVDWVG